MPKQSGACTKAECPLVTAIVVYAKMANTSFSVGRAYSGELKYTSQPRLDGLLHSYALLKKVLPPLNVVKKPTEVKAAVEAANKK